MVNISAEGYTGGTLENIGGNIARLLFLDAMLDLGKTNGGDGVCVGKMILFGDNGGMAVLFSGVGQEKV